MKRLSAKLSLTSNQLISFFQKKSKIQSANGFSNGNTISTNGISNNVNSSTGKVDYQASSPDEKALVEAADRFGITFLGEDGNNLVIGIADDTELYERLQLIEFTSERKRMSVVLKDKDGKVIVVNLVKTSQIKSYKDIKFHTNQIQIGAYRKKLSNLNSR